MVQVRTGANDEINESIVHQCNDTAAQSGRSERTCHSHTDSDISLRVQHLFNIEACRFIQACRIICLELLVDQFGDGHIWANPMWQYLWSTQVVILG